MPINVRQVDNVDTLPPPSNVREIPPWQSSPVRLIDWRVVGVLCLFLLLACPLAWLIVGEDVRAWVSYGWGGKAIVALFALGFVYAILFALRSLLIIEQPGGFKVAIWNAHAPQVVDRLIGVHDTFAGTAYRGVAAQTISYPQKFELPAPVEEVPQITVGPALVPDREWLTWIDRTPHLMLAGRTDAGKTTMAEALLAQRIQAGDKLLICDPHYQPGKWAGLDAVGGGKDFEAILSMFPRVLADMDARYLEFNAGKRTEDFERLTVFIDEVPAIIEATFRMTASGTKKIIDDRWQRFARQLGSQARKVRISVVLLTQSIYVEDLMINSAFKENFVRIGLGDKARSILAEEPDNATKRALYELLKGQAHPAALEHNGEVHLLDTAGVPALAGRRLSHMAQLWQPPARLAVAAHAQPSGVVRASVAAGAIVYPPTVKSENGKIAFLLRSGYTYRQIERELGVSHSTISTVNKALRARENSVKSCT